MESNKYVAGSYCPCEVCILKRDTSECIFERESHRYTPDENGCGYIVEKENV